jgi:hypothetical protein
MRTTLDACQWADENERGSTGSTIFAETQCATFHAETEVARLVGDEAAGRRAAAGQPGPVERDSGVSKQDERQQLGDDVSGRR